MTMPNPKDSFHDVMKTVEKIHADAVRLPNLLQDGLTEVRGSLEALSERLHEAGAQQGDRILSLRDALAAVEAGIGEVGPDKKTQERLVELEQQLNATENSLRAAQAQVQESASKLESAVPAGEAVQAHIRELESHLEKRGETINVARKRILRMQEKLEMMAADKAGGEERLKDLETTLERRNAALKTAEERFSDLRRKLESKTTGSSGATQAQIRAFETQLEELQKTAASLEAANVGVNRDLQKKTAEEAALRQRLEQLKNQAEDAEKERDDAVRRMEGLEDELRRRTSTGEQNADQYRRAVEALSERERQLESAQQELEQLRARIHETMEERAALESRLGELSPRQEQLQSELNRAKESVIHASEERAHLENELSDTRKKVAILEESNRNEGNRADKAEADYREQAAAVERLTAERDGLQKQIQDLERELAAKSEALSSAEQRAASQAEEAAAMKNKAEAVHSRIATLESDLSERDHSLENAERRADEAEEKASIARAEAESMRHELALSAPADEVEGLRQEIGRLNKELETEQERVVNAQERLDEELAKGLKSVLAQQLTEAIRDAEEAREELRQLRKETEKLRKTGAAVSVAPPAHDVEDVALGDDEALQKVITGLSTDKRRNLGEALAAARLITRRQLQDLVAAQKKAPESNIAALIHERKLIDDDLLAKILANQSGLPPIDLANSVIDPDVTALIPERVAKKFCCIPVRLEDEGMVLVLAMANPMDLLAIEDIGHLTGKQVSVVIARYEDVEQALGKYYWEPE